ncbi:MAG: GNAT family N-acetyltransferase [Proteobacteria bacterium]|nr:GNAT family N-acetyltransferase [Pseudomonadota bacterium]
MDIRPFERRDAAAVIDLVLGIQNDEFHFGLSICDQRDLEDIEAYYLKGGGTFFVAAGHRGREHGVARALYDRFIAFAQREGIRQIVLDTPSAATRSHGFYRSVGFVQIERSELPMRYDFPERDTLFFALAV